MYLLTDSRTAFLCEILLCLLIIVLAKYGVSETITLYVLFFSPLLLISILFQTSSSEAPRSTVLPD